MGGGQSLAGYGPAHSSKAPPQGATSANTMAAGRLPFDSNPTGTASQDSRHARVASAAVNACTTSARRNRRPWNANRGAGRLASMSAKSSPAGIARRSQAPSHPIPRGFAGPSLLAMVLVNKFLLHQPLNRQSKTYAREGIEIDVST